MLVGGTLKWGARFEHPTRMNGTLKITEIEIPFDYRGVLKEKAKKNISEIIYRKVTSNETYLVKEVDFNNQIVEVIKYEF